MADNRNDPAIAREQLPAMPWIAANYFDCNDAYGARRPEGSPAWLLFCTVKGEGCIRLRNEDFLCREREVHLLAPGTPHHYFTMPGQRWLFYWAYFIPRQTWVEWLQLKEHRPGLVIPSALPESTVERIQATCRKIESDCKSTARHDQELALGGVEEILLLLHQAGASQRETRWDARIAAVYDEIRRRYATELSVADLAKTACLSPSRLAHLYKLCTGESIVQTQHRIRIEQSARLLHASSLPIARIAEIVGFQSVNFFAKKFRQHYGTSPSGYRTGKE